MNSSSGPCRRGEFQPAAGHPSKPVPGTRFTVVDCRENIHSAWVGSRTIWNGEITYLARDLVILVSDFGFADLNGDDKSIDLDISKAVVLRAARRFVPVHHSYVLDSYVRGLHAGRLAQCVQISPSISGCSWELRCQNLTGNFQCAPIHVLGAFDCSEPTSMYVDCKMRSTSRKNFQIKKDFAVPSGFAMIPLGREKTVSPRRLRHLLRPHHV